MDETNEALWLDSAGGRLQRGPAPCTRPGALEVLVRTRTVAVNPVDTMSGWQRRFVYPWLSYPAVLGTDVAGEVVEVGPGVTHVGRGDRVIGLAAGQERGVDSPARGAFQRFAVLPAATTTPIPSDLTFEQAVVLPLATATASAGLFGADQLGLAIDDRPTQAGSTVVVWGGSTSVGCNAVQLARHSGHRVVATAAPQHHAMLRDLGAAEVVDRHDRTAAERVVEALGDGPLVGVLAIGAGSTRRAVRVAAAAREARSTPTPPPISTAHPSPVTSAVAAVASLRGVRVSSIWGGTVIHDGVGESVFTRVLPAALAAGTYRPAPPAEVVGHGLDAVPAALARLSRGVSARKLVVVLDR